MRHRLQRAHLDKELAGDVTGEKTILAGEHPAHAFIFGDDRKHDLGRRRDRAWILRRAHMIALRGNRLRVLVPGDDLVAAFAQPLRDRRTHAPKANQTDFHRSPACCTSG